MGGRNTTPSSATTPPPTGGGGASPPDPCAGVQRSLTECQAKQAETQRQLQRCQLTRRPCDTAEQFAVGRVLQQFAYGNLGPNMRIAMDTAAGLGPLKYTPSGGLRPVGPDNAEVRVTIVPNVIQYLDDYVALKLTPAAEPATEYWLRWDQNASTVVAAPRPTMTALTPKSPPMITDPSYAWRFSVDPENPEPGRPFLARRAARRGRASCCGPRTSRGRRGRRATSSTTRRASA